MAPSLHTTHVLTLTGIVICCYFFALLLKNNTYLLPRLIQYCCVVWCHAGSERTSLVLRLFFPDYLPISLAYSTTRTAFNCRHVGRRTHLPSFVSTLPPLFLLLFFLLLDSTIRDKLGRKCPSKPVSRPSCRATPCSCRMSPTATRNAH